MKTSIVIIEDEKSNAKRLQRMLAERHPELQVQTVLQSVEESVAWLNNNLAPDLLFMDVQLTDGLCFEIFESIRPDSAIIFTTAYDEYALKAFKVNSVDYLLKPIDADELDRAIEKYYAMFKERGKQTDAQLEGLLASFLRKEQVYKSRFLIRQKNRYQSVLCSEIACFALQNQLVYLYTADGRKLLTDLFLDELESSIDPRMFFRINRQMIINLQAIKTIEDYPGKRLRLILHGKIDMEIIVSREKVPQLKTVLDY